MSALEEELIEKIRKLDDAGKLRVLEFVNQVEPKEFDFEAWMHEARAFRQQLREKYGEDFVVDSISLLHEAREERLNAIMDSLFPET